MGIQAMHTAATGMSGMDRKLDVLANNLSNVNTTSFKRQRALFSDLLYQEFRAAGTLSGAGRVPEGIQVGLGTRLAGVSRDFRQGSLLETGAPLDIAVQGAGFFQVELPDGTIAYTRDGHFTFDPTLGRLVNANGNPLVDSVAIPPNATNLTISREGIVQVSIPGSDVLSQVGQIQLARFQNPGGLTALGDNIYVVRDEQTTGAPELLNPGQDGMGILQQGFLEASNVDLVTELVEMIKTQRGFEINSQMIQATNEMLRTVNDLRR